MWDGHQGKIYTTDHRMDLHQYLNSAGFACQKFRKALQGSHITKEGKQTLRLETNAEVGNNLGSNIRVWNLKFCMPLMLNYLNIFGLSTQFSDFISEKFPHSSYKVNIETFYFVYHHLDVIYPP